jgi:GT2 family glycosyltransferase
MNANRKWRHQFQLWREGTEEGSLDTLKRLLKRHRAIGLDLDVIQSSLQSLHLHLDAQHLQPQLLPLSLLLQPDQWHPAHSGIHELACLSHHQEIKSLENLLCSGVLNQILKGERSLYSDLPPIPLLAYRDGLKQSQRQLCKQTNLSTLEHLAREGWRRFNAGQPVAVGLDRYQPAPLPQFEYGPTHHKDLIVVLGGCEEKAQKLAVHGGWQQMIWSNLQDLSLLWQQLSDLDVERISVCHGTDEIARGARFRIDKALTNAAEPTVLSSDDVIVYGEDIHHGFQNRQYRSAPTAIRLLTRGTIGGLINLPAAMLRSERLQRSYTCLHSFKLDLALQACHQGCSALHIHQPLVKTSALLNPCVPEQGWPAERHPFTQEQLDEISAIKQRHARINLKTSATLRVNPWQASCHDLLLMKTHPGLVSILIPFRDRVDLTKICLRSLQAHASDSISFEIILIDNGSQEECTQTWVEEITKEANIHCLRVNEPFNFSRLNNLARKLCKGEYLLFLNNDIEFRSPNVLNQLLDPFAYPGTAAVGSRLFYPDHSIQHQGVVIIKGERRCVLEPGKHLHHREIIDSLVPLTVQEEFSAASAACLLVKADRFDAIGGFDEDLAVVFNDVDLCLRLRTAGGNIVVTPHPTIIHHESVSRGKDLEGKAWARHQRESGLLRKKHAALYDQGDSLTSPHLHHHSNRYEPAPPPPLSLGFVREQVLYTWQRSTKRGDQRPVMIFAQYGGEISRDIRKDVLALLRIYRRNFYVVVVAATPSLLQSPRSLSDLRRDSDAVVIRRNEGYDYGSWMTGLRAFKELVIERGQLLLSNDSFWGPVRPINQLLERLKGSTADVVGLTDNLMYEPHLQSPFLLFRKKVINNSAFWEFWDNIDRWETKRNIVKHYEVGLPVLLKKQGMILESLYSNQSNGNIFHAEWRSLIVDQGFPFIKLSLLRDNPHRVDLDGWQDVVDQYNPWLTRQIVSQLQHQKSLATSPPLSIESSPV